MFNKVQKNLIKYIANMDQKKFKILIGFIYTIIIVYFLYELLSRVSLQDITSYSFIQSYQEKLESYKTRNIFILIFAFCVFVNFWVLMLGFGSPVAIIAGGMIHILKIQSRSVPKKPGCFDKNTKIATKNGISTTDIIERCIKQGSFRYFLLF